MVFLIFILFSSFPAPSVLAHHRGMVLGSATDPTQLILPSVSQGAGLFLPDSPFYFLDEAFQNLRLKLTLDPQKRAKLGTQIAGERLAELKIMLFKNNPQGIDVALARLKAAEDLTSKNLNEAGARGLNVGNLSQEINDAVRSHQEALAKLENQASGSLRLKFKAAREGVKETKLEVEDHLPEDVLEQEIQTGLEREIEEKVKDASFSARHLERQIEQLQKEGSDSAQKLLRKKEELLLKAQKEKNEVLKKEAERNLELEKKKQERLLKTREEMTEKAKKFLQMNREASEEFKNLHQKTREIKSENLRELPKSEK